MFATSSPPPSGPWAGAARTEPQPRAPLRTDLLDTLMRLHREGVAARETRRLVPDAIEHRDLIRWEQRAARELRSMFDEVGWPGLDVVGEVGAEAAWWCVLLCDRLTAFQRDAHGLLQDAGERQAAPARHLAYLDDRLLMHHGEPQQFGTQHQLFADGCVEPYPVDNPALVAERRRSIGLPPTACRTAALRLLSLTRGPPLDDHR
ncbi:DUF6624 domain-containing protein [Streptomyces mobaraensis]|uniref:Uncharacterized protein n=1 Tax=Streptomyces mobaraensis TaxID=35621 RepID=A0A5N5W325_STRMB|nr:DUF6624 domain-containing protein [Streptomyces mobaraensis]KAB7835763.1 hypothetical protein FRZ00_26450 [Streptomyces mobaraensis]